MMALESHQGKKLDRERAVATMSAGTVKGLFPTIEAEHRRK
jgi:hypothetical protein